jgi:hypothetical protein
LVAEQPTCTYCGGTAATTSRDHCPPIGIFDGSKRPRGLEFGACRECHDGTRAIDQLAAVASRLLFIGEETPEQRADTRRHIEGLVNNQPQLALAFRNARPASTLGGRTGYAISLDGQDRLHSAMRAFGARVGLALYRERVGQPAPSESVILARWYSNVQLEHDEQVENFIRSFGAPHTLVMGRQNVVEQFRFWGGPAGDDPTLFGAFAAFRQSFGVVAIISTDSASTGWDATALANNASAYRPGFLKGYSP